MLTVLVDWWEQKFNDTLEYGSFLEFPLTWVESTIYVSLDDNKLYRWDWVAYVEVSPAEAAPVTLTWDVTWTGTWSIATTLSSSWATPWTYTNSTVTVDAKWRVTNAVDGSVGTVVTVNETPSGNVNWSNTVFTLSATPASNEVMVTINWLKQKETTDYTVSGTTLTFVVAPFTWALIEVFYVNANSTLNTWNLVVPKTSWTGIKVDQSVPTFPWHDIIWNYIPDSQGWDAPTLAVFRWGSCRFFAYSANDRADFTFHIPHDYLPWSDLFVHVHWLHNGTAISWNFAPTIKATYAKGHNQSEFPAEVTLAGTTVSTPNIATIPRYRHRVDEFQLSTAGGTANLLNTTDIEVDGIVSVSIVTTTIPTITGWSPNDVFIATVDVHYQSTNIGTKQKSPNFYV